MKENTVIATKVTLWTNRFIALILGALIFLLPTLVRWYCQVRVLSEIEIHSIYIAFYLCALVSAVALWNLDALLRNILLGRVFVHRNAVHVHNIQWCCGGVGAICFPASFGYPPLIFLAVIMAFLCLVVGVLSQVMKAAVAIREENDLTI